MEFWNLLMGGQGQAWLSASFLVCLFWVALVKPLRIRSLAVFRIACLFFAASLVTPALVNLFLAATRLAPMPPRIGQQDPGWSIYLSAVAPVLFMISFLLAIESVIPGRRETVFDEDVYLREPRESPCLAAQVSGVPLTCGTNRI